MPSPFPGMDPFLEAPDIWPDFHNALATKISSQLNRVLPSGYYSRLNSWKEIGIEEDIDSEPIKHAFVEIRERHRPLHGHRLVTLIEIASPSNKRTGVDRQAYIKKQREVLDSDASLIELDLLRPGQRLFAGPELEHFVSGLEPAPDYLVMVHRAWKRQRGELACHVFPIQIEELLPCISVPLREEIPEVPLDLQFLMTRAYDEGPYRRGAVDYAKPPEPPLNPDKNAWLENCLAAIRKG